jgi:protein involved in polysaccharide export with SLBB domain
LITSKLLGQVFPTYPERSFTDSSYSALSASTISEGAVDPNEYIVGPGDEFFIAISGVQENSFRVKVDPEGNLYIPKSGSVDLRNKTLADAREIIINQLTKSFRNVDYYISLSSFRRIKVSLVGDVKNPSTYVLTSNSRLLDLLKSSTGLNASSDIRNIIINSKDGSNRLIDFLAFLRLGDFSQNPFLREGDVVLIDRVNKMVTINGQVKYPAQYEFKEGESIAELIELAGGLLFNARKDSIEIIRFADDGKNQYCKYFSYNEILENPVKLNFGDQVIIRILPEYFISQFVTVTGKVKYPGLYKIVKDKTTLSEILKNTGGFMEDASLVDATLTRTEADTTTDPEYERIKLIPRADMTDDEYDYLKSKSRQRVGKVVVDFEKLILENKASEDIILKRGDQINIPEKKNYIIIIGQVVKPGNIIYNPSFKVEDYIEIAGGFSWRAIEGDVRVIKVNTGEWVDADDVESLDPGDTIWVLEDPPGPKFWDVFTTSLSILAQLAAIVAASVAVIVATR